MAVSPVQDEAVVLKIYDYGEADGIAVLLSRAHGKVRALARGFRKPKFRSVSPFTPFSTLEVKLRPAAPERLWSILEVTVLDGGGAGTMDLEAFALRSYAAEILLHTEMDTASGERFFRLFRAVSAVCDARPPLLLPLLYFQVWALKLEGILPDPSACGSCGAVFSPDYPPAGYLPSAASFVCPACREAPRPAGAGCSPVSGSVRGEGRRPATGPAASPEDAREWFALLAEILVSHPANLRGTFPCAALGKAAAEGFNEVLSEFLGRKARSFPYLLGFLGDPCLPGDFRSS
ncbi:MAG: DNA repair protein RecO [Acidobacteria bacterium]|nr:DNA repair protein RecO [Acidobacteriota bacterium]